MNLANKLIAVSKTWQAVEAMLWDGEYSSDRIAQTRYEERSGENLIDDQMTKSAL